MRGLPSVQKKIKRIRQCQRTCQDDDNAVLNRLFVLLLLLPHIKVTKRKMMLPMLWRDCLRWLPPDCYLRTLWRGMELKGVLTRMTMNMDGENIYINVGCKTIKKITHSTPSSPARPAVLGVRPTMPLPTGAPHCHRRHWLGLMYSAAATLLYPRPNNDTSNCRGRRVS